MVLRNVLQEVAKVNKERLSKDPHAAIYEMEDLVELNKEILGKNLKKMLKAGVDEDIAFNVLSIIKDSMFSIRNDFGLLVKIPILLLLNS